MSILDKLKQRQQNRQQTTAEKYRTLLEQIAATPDAQHSEHDVETLDSLSSQLGFDPSQVEADLQAIRQLYSLQSIVADEPRLRELRSKASEAFAAYQKYVENESRKVTAEMTRLDGEKNRAHGEWAATMQSQNEIESIKRKSPHLFA